MSSDPPSLDPSRVLMLHGDAGDAALMKLLLHRHPRLHPPQDQLRVVKARQKVVEPQ